MIRQKMIWKEPVLGFTPSRPGFRYARETRKVCPEVMLDSGLRLDFIHVTMIVDSFPASP
jgi:hypothetical protein